MISTTLSRDQSCHVTLSFFRFSFLPPCSSQPVLKTKGVPLVIPDPHQTLAMTTEETTEVQIPHRAQVHEEYRYLLGLFSQYM